MTRQKMNQQLVNRIAAILVLKAIDRRLSEPRHAFQFLKEELPEGEQSKARRFKGEIVAVANEMMPFTDHRTVEMRVRQAVKLITERGSHPKSALMTVFRAKRPEQLPEYKPVASLVEALVTA
jgi:hypothetical protein